MDKAEVLEELKNDKINEVEYFYKKYKLEINKETEFPFSISEFPFYSFEENNKETKTIRLSNSTTPMACY